MRYRVPGYVTAGVLASAVAAILGYLQKTPCSSGGAWNSFTGQFRDACYTDIYPLYYNEGLSSGRVPYYGHPVEYPVLTGGLMQLASWAVHSVSDAYSRGRDFYYVTILLLALCLIAGVVATAATAHRESSSLPGGRPPVPPEGAPDGKDRHRIGRADAGRNAALLVAFSPGLVLSAYINWDLLAMALTACGLAAWAARREVLAGALLGLGVAAKFYPLLIIAALVLVCLRAGKLRELGKALAGGAVAWLAVNLPVALTANAGWAHFYAFSRSRGADWGSIWYLFQNDKVPVLGNDSIGRLNLMSSGLFAVACIAIAVMAFAAPRRPRLPQLAFLILAAFLALNKGWSPQYVVWLVPLAVLARPRLWPYVLWQLAEVAYFFGIWGYFVWMYRSQGGGGFGVSPGWYFAILAARWITVAVLAATVVRDIYRPERDQVRASGENDDPAGGVLDGAPDRLVLVWHSGDRHPDAAAAS